MLATMDDAEELQGGLNLVRRVGSTVIRPAGDHTPSVHRLLRHVRAHGFQHAPEPLALDVVAETETLSFMPGEVGQYPLPEAFRTDETLVAAARLLRAYHAATVGFEITERDIWYLPTREPAEVICHGDFAPYNCALAEDGKLSMFDFDTAHPGPRLADIGYAAYRWVPLTDPSNNDGFGDLDEQRRRFRLFCDTYGDGDLAAVLDHAAQRLTELVDLMRRSAGEGHAAFASHVAEGHDQRYLNDIAHIRDNADHLAS